MLRIFSYLALSLFGSIPAYADNHGTFTAFRWNQGFRAERDPLYEKPISEKEFRAILATGKLPASDSVYRGCYLVNYRPAQPSRELASKGLPDSETYKICVPAQAATRDASQP